jgi:hypothetical protein
MKVELLDIPGFQNSENENSIGKNVKNSFSDTFNRAQSFENGVK